MSGEQKQRFTPPLVGIGHLRRAHDYSIDDVIEGLKAITGRTYTRGAISAVENGHRRPSDALMAGLIKFYDLDDEPHVHARPRLVPAPNRTKQDAA